MQKKNKPCIIIPVYRHGKACLETADSLAVFKIPLIIVDDGNDAETKGWLSEIKQKYPDITELVSLPVNSGKGAAFTEGIKYAHELGFTHALQIDADGQHDSSRTEFFFEEAEKEPDALICGYPEYDESAPGHRKNGRKFANTWCSIVTWTNDIKDSMCGFRVYPVEQTYKFLSSHRIDRRMGFDIDILVRLIWKGIKCRFYPVHVTYPSDGISNFRIVRDNIRISWIFTKLCCGMLIRIPVLSAKRIKRFINERKQT